MSKGLELAHDGVHLVMIPLATWLWNERRILKEVLEGELERRLKERRTTMPLLADAALIEKGLALAPELLPQVAQVLADVNKLVADITAALAADSAALKGTTPPPPPAAA